MTICIGTDSSRSSYMEMGLSTMTLILHGWEMCNYFNTYSLSVSLSLIFVQIIHAKLRHLHVDEVMTV